MSWMSTGAARSWPASPRISSKARHPKPRPHRPPVGAEAFFQPIESGRFEELVEDYLGQRPAPVLRRHAADLVTAAEHHIFGEAAHRPAGAAESYRPGFPQEPAQLA